MQELYTFFKEKHSNVNIGSTKFCALRPKWCVLGSSKTTHSVCVCSAHQNFVLLVDAVAWDLADKDLIKKIVCSTESNKCILHRCKSCPVTPTLKECLDQGLNEHEDDEKFNYCQWDTTERAILTTFTALYEEYKETLIDVIDDLTRVSYESYIPWLYTASDQHDSLFFSSDDNNRYTSFLKSSGSTNLLL